MFNTFWRSSIALTMFLVAITGLWLIGNSRHQTTLWAQGGCPTCFTRTATPEPPPPTTEPGGGGGGGGGGNEPTATPGPTTAGTTPVASPVVVTVGPTPLGGYLPTAEPCSTEPTVLSFGTVFVRSGPGTNFEAVDSLQYLEVRPIRGRAQNAEWWLIDLGDGTLGWVANVAIQVQGYTGLVPIVTPPALPNGTTPTPGPLWNPTPNPVCTVVPTATATVTPSAETPASTATATATMTNTPAPSPTTGLATVAVVATNTVPAAATTIVPTNPPPTPAISAETLTPTAPVSNTETGTTSNAVLYVGLGLIVTAGLVGVATRMRR